jgi:hypothetical protein
MRRLHDFHVSGSYGLARAAVCVRLLLIHLPLGQSLALVQRQSGRPPIAIDEVQHDKVPGNGYRADSPLYAKQEAWHAAEQEADQADRQAAAMEQVAASPAAASPMPAVMSPVPAPAVAEAAESCSWWPFDCKLLNEDYWLNWRWVDEKAKLDARPTTAAPDTQPITVKDEMSPPQEPDFLSTLHGWWLSALILIMGCCCLAGVATWSQLSSKPLARDPREPPSPAPGRYEGEHHPGGHGVPPQHGNDLPPGYSHEKEVADVQLDGPFSQHAPTPGTTPAWEASGQYQQNVVNTPMPHQDMDNQPFQAHQAGAAGYGSDFPSSFHQHSAMQPQMHFSQQR